MKKIFISGEADLSGLYKNGDLFVSKIIHKTYLKVNEVGTEAAAITLVTIDEAIFEERKEIIHKMKVNRPFLFLLKNSRLPDGYNMVFIAKIEKI
jgi:serpin B